MSTEADSPTDLGIGPLILHPSNFKPPSDTDTDDSSPSNFDNDEPNTHQDSTPKPASPYSPSPPPERKKKNPPEPPFTTEIPPPPSFHAYPKPDFVLPSEPPKYFEEIHRRMLELEPLETVLARSERVARGTRMMGLCMNVEVSLGRISTGVFRTGHRNRGKNKKAQLEMDLEVLGGELREVEGKNAEALRIAEGLRDWNYVERCEYFVKWIAEIREFGERLRERMLRRASKGRAIVEGDYGDDEEEEYGEREGRRELAAPVSSSASASAGAGKGKGKGAHSQCHTDAGQGAGGELLGDILPEDFGDEADWETVSDATPYGTDSGSDFYTETETDTETETETEYEYETAAEHISDYETVEESEYETSPEEPITSRPRTPEPRGFDSDDEDEDISDHILRPDDWDSDSDFESDMDSDYDSDFSPLETQTETETETESEPESYAYSSDSSADDPEPLTPLDETRKRKHSSIPNAPDLRYSFIHHHRHSKPSSSPRARHTSKPSKPAKLATIPKPWLPPTDETLETALPNAFCDAHANTLLLQDSAPQWDMQWLTAWQTSPFRPRQTKFTFRKRMRVRDMASRWRTTDIFPEQEWEYIPDREKWEGFQEELAAQPVSLRYLEWENEMFWGLPGANLEPD